MTNDPHHSALELFRSALAELAHRIRTPLSTLSNDLAFMKKIAPNEDLGSSDRACAAIGAELAAWERRFSTALRVERLPAAALGSALGLQVDGVQGGTDLFVCADGAALRTVCELLCELTRAAAPRLIAEDGSLIVRFAAEPEQRRVLRETTVAAIAATAVESSVVDALWADAVLIEHRARILTDGSDNAPVLDLVLSLAK